ncbi:MAG: 50S ribosomal protein L25 [Phycisphaerae bacterium]|nr:50S ribosomal protein L25 [Phycisphaerae bacterium]
MSKETPVLTAQRRERFGTRYARRLRESGRLPAVIYGHGADPVAVSLDAKETITTLKHGVHVLNVVVEGGKAETCLVKDLQFGFLGDDVVHVDLARVDLDEVVTVKVRLNFFGQPESARKPGAVLVHAVNDVEVSCKVREIPSDIKVDISNMEDDFVASQIKLPAGLTLVTPPNTMVCHVEIVKEEVVVAPEAAVAEAAAEPEVLTARKDKEGEEGAAAKDAKPGKEAKEG